MGAHIELDLFEEASRRIVEAEIERAGWPVDVPRRSSSGLALSLWPMMPTQGRWALTNVTELFEPNGWSAHMPVESRGLGELRAWMERELCEGQSVQVRGEDRVSKYLGVTGTVGQINMVVDAFLIRLNRAEGFGQDGLALIPGDVPSDPTVNQLLKAIVADYERRDIEVLL